MWNSIIRGFGEFRSVAMAKYVVSIAITYSSLATSLYLMTFNLVEFYQFFFVLIIILLVLSLKYNEDIYKSNVNRSKINNKRHLYSTFNLYFHIWTAKEMYLLIKSFLRLSEVQQTKNDNWNCLNTKYKLLKYNNFKLLTVKKI